MNTVHAKRILFLAGPYFEATASKEDKDSFILFKELQKCRELELHILGCTNNPKQKPRGGIPFKNFGKTHVNEMAFCSGHFDPFMLTEASLHLIYSRFENDLKSYISELQPSIVHFFSSAPIGLEAIVAAKHVQSKPKVIFEINNSDFLNKKHSNRVWIKRRQLWIKTHLEMADHVLVRDKKVQKQYLDLGLENVTLEANEPRYIQKFYNAI